MYRIVVMFLEADNGILGAGEFLHSADALDHIFGIDLHDLLVYTEEGLTLGSVCKDIFCLAIDLYMGGKACTACAENTGVTDYLCQFHRL